MNIRKQVLFFVLVVLPLVLVCSVNVYAGSQIIVPVEGTYYNTADGLVVENLSEKAPTLNDTMQGHVMVDLTDFTIPASSSDTSVTVAVVQTSNSEVLASNIKTIIDDVFQSPVANLYPYRGEFAIDYYKQFPVSTANGNNVKVVVTGSSGKKYFESKSFSLFEYTSADTGAGNTNSNNNTSNNSANNSSNTNNTASNNSQNATPSQVGAFNFKLQNPLRTNDFWGFLGTITDLAIKIGVPIAVVFFIWAGFQYIFAGGDTKKIDAAHINLRNVVIGTIIFLGAWTITELVVKTFQSVLGS